MRSYSLFDTTRVPPEVIAAELRGEIPMNDEDIAQMEDFTRCNNCQQKIAGSVRQHKAICRPEMSALVMDPISDEWQAYLDRRWPNRAARRVEVAAELNIRVEGLTAALMEHTDERGDFHDVPLNVFSVINQELRNRRIAACAD